MNKNYEEFSSIMKKYGYIKGFDDLDIKLDDYKVLHYLEKNLNSSYTFEKINTDRLSRETMARVEKYFCIKKVRAIKDYKKFMDNKKFDSKFINSISEAISPFEIFISYVDAGSEKGCLTSFLLEDEVRKYEKLENIDNNLFVSISLGRDLDLLSITTYAHEIMHTQLNSMYGYTDDFRNKEVLSIFLEMLVALDLDNTRNLLRGQIAMRCKDLECALSDILTYNIFASDEEYILTYDRLVNASSYITSTFKAMFLFDKYLSFIRNSKKRQMIYTIQDVIDGKIQLEELLAKYNIGDVYETQKLKIIKKVLKR